MYTAVLHPTNMQKLIACTLDDGRSGVRADDRERWSSVTASLQLTQDQKSQTVSLRQIFLRRMSKVMEARRTILSKLQMVNIPDRMLALQSVISETLKVCQRGTWAPGLGGCWTGCCAAWAGGGGGGAGLPRARLSLQHLHKGLQHSQADHSQADRVPALPPTNHPTTPTTTTPR